RPPREARWIEPAEHVDQRDAGDDGLEDDAIRDVNLAPAARLFRMLLKRRFEARGPEVHAVESRAIHRRGKLLRVDPRRPHQLERSRRPAAFREHGALEE